MTGKETRQYEMLARIHAFGEKRKRVFPDASEGGQAFAGVADVVAQLQSYDAAKTKSSDEGKQAKLEARQALLGKMRTISDTAKAIATTTPLFADRFKLPRWSKSSNRAIIGAGRVFVEAAEAAKTRFVAKGMKETFVSDLQALVNQFEETVLGRQEGKEQRAVAQRGLTKTLARGLEHVRQLDVIVPNLLEDDHDALAAWEHDRKIELPRRVKRKTTEEASATPAPSTPSPAPVAPTAASSEAVSPASEVILPAKVA